MEINTPEELEALPVGTIIDDRGLLAKKAESGAWNYGLTDNPSNFWEPELPVRVWSQSA